MELVDNNNRPPLHKTGPNTATNTNSNELLICFTSRLSSSSSMKIAKSILSPGRARDPPVSLSTSLSRRLRTNGSIKSGAGGMASPMFPKKKGPGFENPEPSSPKVTCIGQVRVKTKKKVKQQTRSLSRRRSGEVSFRRVGEVQSNAELCGSPVGVVHSSSQIQHQECMNGRNQKWVHLPVTICEALRTFGAEFSCLFPCRSSCSSREKGKEEVSEMGNNGGGSSSSSCGAVFTRWFVSLQDCEGGKGREIELVVGGGDEEEEGRTEVRQRISMRSSRRHVFDDLEFNEEMVDVKNEKEEEEKGRVSVCVPPKNALLLMRCRSDPMKMADLTNRFWESPVPPEFEDEEQDENVVPDAEVSENVVPDAEVSENAVPDAEVSVNVEQGEGEESNNGEEETEEMVEDANLLESVDIDENFVAEKMEEFAAEEEVVKANEDEEMEESEEAESNIDAFEDLLGEETAESSIQWQIEQEEIEETNLEFLDTTILYEDCETLEMQKEDAENSEKLAMEEDEEEETLGMALFEEAAEDPTAEAAEDDGFEEIEEKRTSTSSNVLPDCLLMMMCEPKLSMEVSKETWVCSTDFVRWLPERPPKKKVAAVPEETTVTAKKKVSVNPLPPLPAPVRERHQQKVQPGRSSCTLPAAAAVSMAAMIEQKLVNAVGYEPFVLTRCKSEPMRTAAAKLLPEACCWKNRKLEPHRNATFGVGAAGVGF